MAKATKQQQANNVVWDAGHLNPKQLLFCQSKTLYTAYGGAKGGGKTHAVRIKAVGGALMNPGIKILIMRRTYTELNENHIMPILKMLPDEAVKSWNGQTHLLQLLNGSVIKFGHWQEGSSEREYQGQEYDWIFIDEATQFTERAFNYLGGCLRGVNKFPKRMYLTCNPGGVGHRWVKRLFIDKQYKTNCENHEENENPDDYTFIFATVEDNTDLIESSPGYVRMLASMPEDQRRAYRYGDWDALSGAYFKEFDPNTHVVKPFQIPSGWPRYRAFDYGLDMLACYWVAVDADGRSWVYREYTKEGLIVNEAAKAILDRTQRGEHIEGTFAPPDMWSTQKDTGKTMAELFGLNGVALIRSNNNRVQGHMQLKNQLAPLPVGDTYVKTMFPDRTKMPGLMFFDRCENVISDLRDIQADETNPDDCAKDPHDITHTVDGIRYYVVSRTMSGDGNSVVEVEREDEVEDYDEHMTGGIATAGYLSY